MADERPPRQVTLRVVQRPPAALRLGGGLFLVIVSAAVLHTVLTGRFPAGLWPYLSAIAVAAVLLAVAAWWSFIARIEVAVVDDWVILTGPWWRRRLPLSGVADVKTGPDTGLNTGLVNWPVTRSHGLVRLNMGGKVAVTWSMSSGDRYQVLVDTQDTADQLCVVLP